MDEKEVETEVEIDGDGKVTVTTETETSPEISAENAPAEMDAVEATKTAAAVQVAVAEGEAALATQKAAGEILENEDEIRWLKQRMEMAEAETREARREASEALSEVRRLSTPPASPPETEQTVEVTVTDPEAVTVNAENESADDLREVETEAEEVPEKPRRVRRFL